jgi:beta-phosphoglucomutase-like phosphatase (HAD superfamily)
MVGILVHGNNHFILSGPLPDEAAALTLARHWSVVQIGETKSPSFQQWQIRTKAFRENLEWAVIVPSDREPSPGVVELLAELSARGIPIHRCSKVVSD